MVFDKADGKPVVHTETQDLSIGGTAIHSEYGDLTGTVVTLLLAQPARHGSEVPKMLKIRALVVSSVHKPPASRFRHGLSFMQSTDDSLNVLAEILASAESARPGGETVAAAEPPAAPAAPEAPSAPAGGRLAKFKQLAQAKQLEKQAKPDRQEEINSRVSTGVENAYRFLKEFTEQLNIVKPAYAKAYTIVGVPSFDGLIWVGGDIDWRTRETSPTTKVFERFKLDFRLSANKDLRVTREVPADGKLKQVLLDAKIGFSTQHERSERGSIIRTTFMIPCEVKATLELVGNFSTGKLLLKTHNIGHFGTLEHVLDPSAITEESLDELTGFILGESSRISPLLLKNA